MSPKKKAKKNPHCPVSGCKTKQPHLASAVTAGLHHTFSDPERCAQWTKHCIVELINSVIADVNGSRFFAYLTRWRQPDEMYYRALYLLFVADKADIPHVVSGEMPNSFSAMQKEVNHTVFGGKRSLDKPQTGLSGEQFTVFDTLNSSAHASFATIVTCIKFAKDADFRTPIIAKHLEYWKSLCNNLDRAEKMFKDGRKRPEVLVEFKNLYANK
jgi:hypothetical protein